MYFNIKDVCYEIVNYKLSQLWIFLDSFWDVYLSVVLFYRSNHVSQIKYLPTCEINKLKYLSQIIIKKLYHLQMFYTNYHKIYKT